MLTSEMSCVFCLIVVNTDDAPEKAMRTSFLSTFGIATDQGGKLGLGKSKSIICMYSSFQVSKFYIHIEVLGIL